MKPSLLRPFVYALALVWLPLSGFGQATEVHAGHDHATAADPHAGHDHAVDPHAKHDHSPNTGPHASCAGCDHNAPAEADPHAGHGHATDADGQPIFPIPEKPFSQLSGPHDIEGLLAIGWLYMKNERFEESIHWVEQGLLDNPKSFQLHYLLGQVNFNNARHKTSGTLSLDNPKTAPLIRAAGRAYEQATVLGIAEKKSTDAASWTDYLDEDLRGAVRMDAMMEHRFGNAEDGIRKAREALAIFGSDETLERNLSQWLLR